MKRIISFLSLITCLAINLQAQQLPPYPRSNQPQVLTDRAYHPLSFFLPPGGNVPRFAAYVPDSLKNGALFNCTGCTPPGLYRYDGTAWVLVGSGGNGLATSIPPLTDSTLKYAPTAWFKQLAASLKTFLDPTLFTGSGTSQSDPYTIKTATGSQKGIISAADFQRFMSKVDSNRLYSSVLPNYKLKSDSNSTSPSSYITYNWFNTHSTSGVSLYTTDGTLTFDRFISSAGHKLGTDSMYMNVLRLGKPINTVNAYFIGNSIFYGVGASSNSKRMSTLLAAYLNMNEINMGVPGSALEPGLNNYTDGFSRLSQVPVFNPATMGYFFTEFSVNDAAFGGTPSNFLAYYNRFLDTLINARHIPPNRIVVIGPTYQTCSGCNAATAPFSTAAQTAAAGHGAYFVDVKTFMAANGGASLVATDMIHPVDAGHAASATIIKKTVPFAINGQLYTQRVKTSKLDVDTAAYVHNLQNTPYVGHITYDANGKLGAAPTVYVDRQNSSNSAVATGVNNYLATISPALTAYAPGAYYIRFTSANTGASTLNLNGLGAIDILRASGAPTLSGDIAPGQYIQLFFDGANFQMLSGAYNEPVKNEIYLTQNAGFNLNKPSSIFNSLTLNNGSGTGDGLIQPAGTYYRQGTPGGNWYVGGETDAGISGITITTGGQPGMILGSNGRFGRFNGGIFQPFAYNTVSTKTTNYNVDVWDNTLQVDATNGSVTQTLLSASANGLNYKAYTFVRMDNSSNTVTIVPASGSGQTINGASSYVLSNQFDYVTIQTDGSKWTIISKGSVSGSASSLTNALSGGFGVNSFSYNGSVPASVVIDTASAVKSKIGALADYNNLVGRFANYIPISGGNFGGGIGISTTGSDQHGLTWNANNDYFKAYFQSTGDSDGSSNGVLETGDNILSAEAKTEGIIFRKTGGGDSPAQPSVDYFQVNMSFAKWMGNQIETQNNKVNSLTNSSSDYPTTGAVTGAINGLSTVYHPKEDQRVGSAYSPSFVSQFISGTGGNGFLDLVQQSISPVSVSGHLRIYPDSLNRLSWKNSTLRRTIRVTRQADMTISMPFRLNPTVADSTDVKVVTDANYNAIGLRQLKALSADPGAPSSTIAAGDSIGMAIWKTQKQINTNASAIAGKQNTLIFDSSPSSGSSNIVNSGNLFTAFGNKVNYSDTAAMLNNQLHKALNETFTGLKTAEKDGLGLTSAPLVYFYNNEAATSGNAKVSPGIDFGSYGWGTTAGTSQLTKSRIYNTSIQAGVPQAQINFDFSVNGAAFATAHRFTSSGNYTTAGTVSAGALISSGNVNITLTATTVSGSTSGSAVFNQPLRGSAWKKVVVYLNALNGTASYTFPTAFTNTPVIMSSNGLSSATVSSLSTTAMTLSVMTATTGYITIEGY